jgi:hypothetical protein
VNQHRGELDVIRRRGPVQCGHAVALRGVDIAALLQQGPYCLAIALHRGIGDRRAGRAAKAQGPRPEAYRHEPKEKTGLEP